MKFLVGLASVASVVCGQSNVIPWVYEEHFDEPDSPVPSEWGTVFPQCSHNFQSPIALNAKHSVYKQYETPLTGSGETVSPSVTVGNFGRGLVLSGFEYAMVSGGPLQFPYVLDSITFHWGNGRSNVPGSEHTINGAGGVLEMQLNFVVDPQQSDVRRRLKWGVLAKLGAPNAELQKIIDKLPSVQQGGQRTPLGQDLDLRGLLPPGYNTDYFYYVGSSTTPPCEPGVEWLVSKPMMEVSDAQVDELRFLMDMTGHELAMTTRPVQHTGFRVVQRSFRASSVDSMIMTDAPRVYGCSPFQYYSPNSLQCEQSGVWGDSCTVVKDCASDLKCVNGVCAA